MDSNESAGTVAQAPGAVRIALADSPEERQRVYKFRYQVYVEEMGKQNISCADHAAGILSDDLDESSALFYVESDGRLVATMRLTMAADSDIPDVYRDIYALDEFGGFPAAAQSFSSRLMIARDMRGSITLHRLLATAYEHGLTGGALFNFCHCSPSLVGLYEHLGYRRYKDNFIDPDVGYRVPMALVVRDEEHMAAVRSPFLRKLRSCQFDDDGLDEADWFATRFPASSRVRPFMLRGEDFWAFMTKRFLAAPSGQSTLLEGLSDDETKLLLQKAVALTCRQGERIVRINDVVGEMYLILSGFIEIRPPDGRMPVAFFGPGEVIGEIGCILGCERSGNVVAATNSEILVISRAQIEQMIANQPALAAKALFNLSRVLCERLVAGIRARMITADQVRQT